MNHKTFPTSPSADASAERTAVLPNGQSVNLASLRHWRAKGSPTIVTANSAAQTNQPRAIQKPDSTTQITFPTVFTMMRSVHLTGGDSFTPFGEDRFINDPTVDDHPAPMPMTLAQQCIAITSEPGDVVNSILTPGRGRRCWPLRSSAGAGSASS